MGTLPRCARLCFDLVSASAQPEKRMTAELPSERGTCRVANQDDEVISGV
jgi:hypothetical protein